MVRQDINKNLLLNTKVGPYSLIIRLEDFEANLKNINIFLKNVETKLCWADTFNNKYIEKMSKKSGSYKSFNIFCDMIRLYQTEQCPEISLTILTYEDLEKIQRMKTNRQDCKFVRDIHNKRYLVLTYTSRFDTVQYPLPLPLVTDVVTISESIPYCENINQTGNNTEKSLQSIVSQLKSHMKKERREFRQHISDTEYENRRLQETINTMKKEEKRLIARVKQLSTQLSVYRLNSSQNSNYKKNFQDRFSSDSCSSNLKPSKRNSHFNNCSNSNKNHYYKSNQYGHIKSRYMTEPQKRQVRSNSANYRIMCNDNNTQIKRSHSASSGFKRFNPTEYVKKKQYINQCKTRTKKPIFGSGQFQYRSDERLNTSDSDSNFNISSNNKSKYQSKSKSKSVLKKNKPNIKSRQNYYIESDSSVDIYKSDTIKDYNINEIDKKLEQLQIYIDKHFIYLYNELNSFTAMLKSLFGRETPREKIRKNDRLIKKTLRQVGQLNTRLVRIENSLKPKIKKMLQDDKPTAARTLAKQLAQTRRNITKTAILESHIQAVSVKLSTVMSITELTHALKSTSSALKSINKQVNLPELQSIMYNFQRENEITDAKSETLDDAMEIAFDEGVEEEGDDVTEAIIGEISAEINEKLSEIHQRPCVNDSIITNDTDDLQNRLDQLKQN
ncbi:CHMP2a [Intoshia linei]|uniref:CHMP2a n=1 Tax=Intoshia linei TaxID=1819745 RepID=A0A177BE49_9BILA|nr:CHMP2a [Intoshia linei]